MIHSGLLNDYTSKNFSSYGWEDSAELAANLGENQVREATAARMQQCSTDLPIGKG